MNLIVQVNAHNLQGEKEKIWRFNMTESITKNSLSQDPIQWTTILHFTVISCFDI